jgi:hypothetical protein
MGHNRKAVRQQARARRQTQKRRRMLVFIGAPVIIAITVAIVVLSSQPGYSSFEVIGKQPAIVQVFLPG